MPASQLLQKRFAGKEIVFIYISLDENSVDWKKASKVEGIDKGESYIIINPENSELPEAYSIVNVESSFHSYCMLVFYLVDDLICKTVSEIKSYIFVLIHMSCHVHTL